MYLIKNVKILTMSDKNEIIENGYILISDKGKIEKISESELFADNVIDAQGLVAMPGLIDAHTHIGGIGDSLGFESDDINETSDSATPFLSALDCVNPADKCFNEALCAGVTTVATGPGSANAIAGNFIVMKTYGKRIDKMVIKSPAAMKIALGENPKTCYHQKNQAPETRMSTAAIIRENLIKAQKYIEAKEKAELDEDRDEPDYDAKLEALMPLLSGEIPAHFHAHRADDIFTAIRIAKEFNLKYNIVHCTDGALIADELKEEKVSPFIGPFICDRSKPELKNLSPATCATLEAAGIDISIITDHSVIPIQYLLMCAMLAHKEGMSYNGALRAITSTPAKALGIYDKVGSLEEGKDADIVLFDGDPLEFYSKVKYVFIDGKLVFTKD